MVLPEGHAAVASNVIIFRFGSGAATHTITLTATADQGGPATDTMVVTEKLKGGGKGAGNSTAVR